MKRFIVDSDGMGKWSVYDKYDFYCVAGPFDEHKAVSLAIELNEKAIAELASKSQKEEMNASEAPYGFMG